jgi:hypothetical protein
MVGRISTVAACVLAALTMAFPAAANEKPTTGARLGLGALAPTTFDANTPFYVEHGFACDLADAPCLREEVGGGAFRLYVDGVLQASTVDVDRFDGGISKLFLSNFPLGLPAGVHTFSGVWLQFGVQVQSATKSVTLG